MRTIDYQRRRVYSAEDKLRGAGRFFRSRSHVQRFVDALVDSDYWRHRGGPERVLVLTAPERQLSARGGRYDRYGWSIRLPMPSRAHYDPGLTPEQARDVWALDEIVVIHELAHVLVIHRSTSLLGHGPEFVTEMVALAAFALGERAALHLAHEFSSGGCDGADMISMAQAMDPEWLGAFACLDIEAQVVEQVDLFA